MKEFSAQTGGRYTYADDLENLQELALAFSQIFDDCDNFIISGCEVSGSAISSGYVFLNGKIRRFSGATGITSWPQYIYEQNSTESVPYESGGAKVGRNIYGCALAKSVPVIKDVLTEKAPVSMVITATGGLRMKDAFIGKYAVLLNPSGGSQTVNNSLTFSKPLTLNGELNANKEVIVKNGVLSTRLCYVGSNFHIIGNSSKNAYQLSFIDGIGFRFYVNGTMIASFTNSTIHFYKPINASQGTFGGLVLTGDSLYQGTATATATLAINMVGYNGGTTQFRDTQIGNGKGKAIVNIVGSTSAVGIAGCLTISAGAENGVVLKAGQLKSNNALRNAVAWTDSANAIMAQIGFINESNQNFSIKSLGYNIEISGGSVVNIGPAIQEGGVLLSDKYVLQTNLTKELAKKANTSDIYTTQQANQKFAVKDGGLAQFVTNTVNAAKCRSDIGAAATTDLNQYAHLNLCLSDMAKDEATKKKIRDNIGAASAGDYQAKLTDSGWKPIKESLYVRQIGNMVSIQGSIKTIHSGTVFTIPNTIAAPTHPVKLTIGFSNNRTWVCKIAANQRACTVVYCDSSCGRSTEFSLTYMV